MALHYSRAFEQGCEARVISSGHLEMPEPGMANSFVGIFSMMNAFIGTSG